MKDISAASKKINRLVLVGNGFDLAHGLKTSYNDFIVWYLKQAFERALEVGKYNDDLINVSPNKAGLESLHNVKLGKVAQFVDHFYNVGLDKLSYQEFKLPGYSNTFQNPFSIIYGSSFFQRLINNCSIINWINIENQYFDTLKDYIRYESSDLEGLIATLNDQWRDLTSHLQNYLNSISLDGKMIGYGSIIYAQLNPDEFVETLSDADTVVGDTLILNFNYTSTVERYLNGYSPNKVDINHIHGNLDDCDNKLIFGFGDELDEDYLKFEHMKSIGQFEFIKSFWYFKTSNYYNLLRFIDSNDYQVYVLGHSCGLSDRTMLNMVFEHDNCKSIKIFYHGNREINNYTSLTQEISRHFKDKPKMRRRIVSFDKSQRMPQYSDKKHP